MKKLFLLTIASCFLSFSGLAQKKTKIKIEEKVSSDNPNQKIVRIEKEIDGKKTVEENIVSIDAPRAKVYTFGNLDTLRNEEKVLRYGDGDFSWEEDFPSISRRYKKNLDGFRFNIDEFSDKLSRDLSQINFDGAFNNVEGFSNVSVYTNKPNTHVLNLKFRSLKNEPVTIAVVDVKGDLVTKEVIEDFEGEYLGQLNLEKGSKGTFFVIISQGENGISRKVKID